MNERDAGEIAETMRAAVASIGRAVKGLEAEIQAILATSLSGGHALIEGPPGTGKTLLARAIAKCLGLSYSRIQFTPDLTPTDIVGATVYERTTGAFRFEKGPIFTDVMVADEINRAPPKTQAALLEAMQERIVTVDGRAYPLGEGFIVVATQNPIEMEGTYPLPEAQVDRFSVKLSVGYPDEAAEAGMLRNVRDGARPDLLDLSSVEPVCDGTTIARFRASVREVKVEDRVLSYIAAIVRGTRVAYGVALGCSPRSGVTLLAASRAAAAMEGRDFVVPDDVKALARRVLAHRIIMTAEAELEGLAGSKALERVLESTELPR
jgi:MoxR-like ATPase